MNAIRLELWSLVCVIQLYFPISVNFWNLEFMFFYVKMFLTELVPIINDNQSTIEITMLRMLFSKLKYLKNYDWLVSFLQRHRFFSFCKKNNQDMIWGIDSIVEIYESVISKRWYFFLLMGKIKGYILL